MAHKRQNKTKLRGSIKKIMIKNLVYQLISFNFLKTTEKLAIKIKLFINHLFKKKIKYCLNHTKKMIKINKNRLFLIKIKKWFIKTIFPLA